MPLWSLLQVLLVLLASLCMVAPADGAQRELKVGVYQNPPKIFFDHAGQASGIHIDLLRQIADREGWQLRFVPCDWQACLSGVQSGLIDLLPDVAYSEERDRLLQFPTVPALYGWSILYRNPRVAIQSVFDLKGKKIGVLGNSVQASYFRNLMDSSGIQVSLVTLQDLETGFRMAAAGQIDGVIASQQVGDMLADRHRLSATNIVFQPVKLFFVSAKGHNLDILVAIDRYLTRWQADPRSIYYEILGKWAPVSTGIPPYVWWLLGGALSLLTCASLMAVYLRREVARRTDKLRQSEASLRIAATAFHSAEAIWVMDAQRKVLEVNAAFTELTGYRLEDLDGQAMPPCRLENSSLDFRPHLWELLHGRGKWHGELLVRKKDGSEFCAVLTLTAVAAPDGEVSHYVGTQLDISAQKALQEETRQLALYDPLTALPNRRLLLEKIQAAVLQAGGGPTMAALFFIDVDNFKDLNDALGHPMGDLLLQQIAARLLVLAGDSGMVARLGGDEFVVLLHALPRTEAAQGATLFAQQIIACMERRFELDGMGHFATCSVGVALMQDGHADVKDLLRQGDLAMYAAKTNGRNTYCLFDMEMEHALHLRIGLEADLRRAIEAGEFALHYQPQRDLAGGLIGVEALARWTSPKRGPVAPGVFIPLAEASGLILPLGQWVLEEACRQAVRWNGQDEKGAVVIAVNVSAVQWRQPDFVDTVLEILARTGAHASHLKLELTESAMVDDVQATIVKMLELKRHGFALSLDDFGTGYSSLSLLKRLPIDQIKIDQSFVRELLVAPSDVAIAKSIIALAEALGLEVIAEGVETLAQQQFLAALGCGRFQGYLIGRPVPPAQFDELNRAA